MAFLLAVLLLVSCGGSSHSGGKGGGTFGDDDDGPGPSGSGAGNNSDDDSSDDDTDDDSDDDDTDDDTADDDSDDDSDDDDADDDTADDDSDDDSDDDTDDDTADDDTLAVNLPPLLATIGDQVVAENETLIVRLSASDSDGDALAYFASRLPRGAQFNTATGVLMWTPSYTQAGNYEGVRLGVSDGIHLVTQSITITVDNTNQAPEFIGLSPRTVDEGRLLVFTVKADDADGDELTYTATNLPTGATFDPAHHVFRWRPGQAQAGVYANILFSADDGSDETQAGVTITVNAVNVQPEIEGDLPVVEFDEDTVGTALIDLDDYFVDADENPLTYTFSDEAPLTLTLDPQNRLGASAPLNWNGWVYNVSVRATDTSGESIDATLTVHVRPVNDPPTITSTPITTGTVGVPYIYQIVVSDVDVGDGFHFETTEAPSGLIVGESTGRVDWLPEIQHWNAGNHIRVVVRDHGGLTAEQEWDVDVSATFIQGRLTDVFTGEPVVDAPAWLTDQGGFPFRWARTDDNGEYRMAVLPQDLQNSYLAFAADDIRYWKTRRNVPAPTGGIIEADDVLIPTTFHNQQKLSFGGVDPCDWNADGLSEANDCPPDYPMDVWIDPAFTDPGAVTEAIDRIEELSGVDVFHEVGTQPDTGDGVSVVRGADCGVLRYTAPGIVCLGAAAPDSFDVIRGFAQVIGYRPGDDLYADLDENNAWASGEWSYDDANLVRLNKALIDQDYTGHYWLKLPGWDYVSDESVLTLEDFVGISSGLVSGYYPSYSINGLLSFSGLLVLLPGTHVRMLSGVEVRGGIVSLGTADQPVVIEGFSQTPGSFGRVSLAQRNGIPSYFEYTVFRNGTEALNLVGDFDPYPIIEDCDFEANHQALSLRTDEVSAGALVTNNLFVGNGTAIWHGTAGAQFVNNVFDGNNEAFAASVCTPSDVRNSVFYENGRTVYGQDCLSILYSDIYDVESATGGTGCFSTEPNFDGNYLPLAGSPLINNGDPSALYNDLDGSRNDMGLYGGPYAR